MSNPAFSTAAYLEVKADINYYTVQENFWAKKQETNAKKVGEQQKLEEKWETAYDAACPADKDLKIGGVVVVQEGNTSEVIAEQYADMKVEDYDEALLSELEDLDLEYDSMKESMESVLTNLRAQETNLKQLVTTNCQDTGTLQG